ncbi:MAG: hypothetical protein ACLSAF_05905 [Intestinimonas sp.]
MTVDVQPLVKEAIDGSYASAAPILGLHIACLCVGDYVIRPWYKRGDVGWVIVADFDSDAALQTGREAEPNTRRNHAPEDSLFLGGVCPAGRAPQGLPGTLWYWPPEACIWRFQKRGSPFTETWISAVN